MEHEAREVLLQVKDLEVTFGTKRRPFVAVKGVSFDIYKGETFGLVGESGSGKTTIGRAIIRINPTSKGEIIFKGEKINGKISRELDNRITQQIQMIFQDPMASLNERAKVDYIVSEGLINVQKHLSKEERESKVSKALADVGLSWSRSLSLRTSRSPRWMFPSARKCSTCFPRCRKSMASPTSLLRTISRSCASLRTASP